MPYLPEQREYRMMPLMESKAEGEENKYTVEGYATTFDDAYLLFNWEGTDYFETIDRNAIDENTVMDDVIFQYDHEGMVYARMHNGTLKLSVDDHGLKIVADLSKTADARNMFENIISGMFIRCRGRLLLIVTSSIRRLTQDISSTSRRSMMCRP